MHWLFAGNWLSRYFQYNNNNNNPFNRRSNRVYYCHMRKIIKREREKYYRFWKLFNPPHSLLLHSCWCKLQHFTLAPYFCPASAYNKPGIEWLPHDVLKYENIKNFPSSLMLSSKFVVLKLLRQEKRGEKSMRNAAT